MHITLNPRVEENAERLFYLYFGTLRTRYMSTDKLKKLYAAWEGEAMLRDIPVAVIRCELMHRGECVAHDWNSK